MINTALIYMIPTDQHYHDHQQYSDNHHDHDDDDQEHPARAGQREDGEQEVQQPEPDHVEPFCPGRFLLRFSSPTSSMSSTHVLLIVYHPQNLDMTILALIRHKPDPHGPQP